MPKALNWYTDPDRVMATMVSLEGEDWGEQQDHGGVNSLPHAIAQMMQPSRFAWQDDAETVYGLGGGHKYYLRGDGRVDFSRNHACCRSHLQAAKELGFHIF